MRETCAPVITLLYIREETMNLENLNERDRKTVEHNQQRLSDIKIVEGLMSQGCSDEKISELMGSPVPHILFLKRIGRLS